MAAASERERERVAQKKTHSSDACEHAMQAFHTRLATWQLGNPHEHFAAYFSSTHHAAVALSFCLVSYIL